MQLIRNAIMRWARNRQPDFVIGGHDAPYLRRHWLLPRNRFFNVYVHEFLRSDDDRALHDHPWAWNATWILEGAYIEWAPTPREDNPLRPVCSFVRTGTWKFRRGPSPHRVQLRMVAGVEQPCWTVFLTGPVVRMWGFYCVRGWVPWREFVDDRDAGSIGKGCAE